MLEERIKLLAKELTFLKDIFMAHAGSAHGITVDDMEIKGLLEEDEVNIFRKTRQNHSLMLLFSGPDEWIGILKFAFNCYKKKLSVTPEQICGRNQVL